MTPIISLFFCTDTPTPDIYTLSLHDALPISSARGRRSCGHGRRPPHARPPLPPSGRRRDGRSGGRACGGLRPRSEEHTSELQSPYDLVCRLLLEKKKKKQKKPYETDKKLQNT